MSAREIALIGNPVLRESGRELTTDELEAVTGGINPQPLPPRGPDI